MDDMHLRCMSYAHRYLRSKFFYAMCSLKRTSAKYVPKGDTSKMYRIAHRYLRSKFFMRCAPYSTEWLCC